jgi:hypothetical protein
MFRRQIINTIRRYSHQHCEKNIPQINLLKNNLITCNRYIENNEQKLDLIQKRICKDIDDVQDSINILFTFNIFTTVILLIKSV